MDIVWERAATGSSVGQFLSHHSCAGCNDNSVFSLWDGRRRVDSGPSKAVPTQVRDLKELSGVH